MFEKRWISIVALVGLMLLAHGGAPAAGEETDPLAHLAYRLIGPAEGGRVARVAGVAGDPLTYWAATASGGVWKSANGGLEWKPVFDDQPISSIGSIAVAPSDPQVVYVGSGEANIRGNVAEGNGIYKSTDGGDSWRHVWQQEGQIGTMVVHPADPDVALAAVLGSPFAPNPERGVYRTTDGGESWQQVLYRDPDTGASDVAFDPSNPRILYAGLWQTRRYPWAMTSGGAGSGLYVSRDAGDTWKQLEGNGLPVGIWGRIGVRVAPSDPNRIYALIESDEGGLYRSDDGGESWQWINASRGLRQRAWYYSTLTVDPRDANVVWFPQVPMLKTEDGGRTIRNVAGGGWDYHDVWIDPRDPGRMIVGSDAGVSLSWDGGETWKRPAIPISQFYHVNTDSRRPYRVLGTIQDLGTRSGPSNSLHWGGILLSDWHSVGGGEAGHIAADPADPNIVWAGEYLGYISRYDARTGQAPHVGVYPDNGSGHGVGDLRIRFQWTAPIMISPHDPEMVYHAGNVLFRTSDGGQSWQAISPDLTRNDPSKQQWSGGPITGDNTGVEFYSTIFAVAESPLERGLIWAGSDDGLVHVTRDDGASWQNVTPPDLPEWGTVACIEASRWDAGTAYLVVDAHRLDNESPYLWKTSDHGRSWKSLSGGLDPEIYLHVVREDDRRRGMLYLGTERGVMYSRDDGASWSSLQLDLPTVAVHDLRVRDDDLVVGTMGRSVWILDDLTPVRELSPEILASPAHLFPLRPAVRWNYASSPAGSDEGAADNPPSGALFTYYLAEEPQAEIVVEVLDEVGEVIRHLGSTAESLPYGPDDPDWSPTTKNEPELTAKAGLNRAHWDLSHEGARMIPAAKIDGGAPRVGPLAVPGTYTLRLRVGDVSQSQPVVVESDPRAATNAADLEAQLALALQVRDQMTEIVEMVETIRVVREQLEAHNQRLGGMPEIAELIDLGSRLAAELTALEEKLHNPHAEVAYDVLAGRHGGAQLYSRLAWLFEGMREHDGPPTQGMREVNEEMAAALSAHRSTLDELLGTDLAELNRRAAAADIPYVMVD